MLGANFHCMCEWLCYFSQEINCFLKTLSSDEYSKMQVSSNSKLDSHISRLDSCISKLDSFKFQGERIKF